MTHQFVTIIDYTTMTKKNNKKKNKTGGVDGDKPPLDPDKMKKDPKDEILKTVRPSTRGDPTDLLSPLSNPDRGAKKDPVPKEGVCPPLWVSDHRTCC
jgi:hypothetical protein